MDLVEDDEADELREGALDALPRDDVPLLGRADDDLRRRDLLLGHLAVARQLAHVEAVAGQPLPEAAHHLLHQRLHRRDVHHLELVGADGARRRVHVLAHLAQDGQQRHVGLPGAGGRAQQQVLVRAQADGRQLRLDPVEALEALEGGARVHRQLLDGHVLLLLAHRLRLQRRHVHLLVALLLLAERPLRQLAPLVGHEVRPVGEGQLLQVEDL